MQCVGQNKVNCSLKLHVNFIVHYYILIAFLFSDKRISPSWIKSLVNKKKWSEEEKILNKNYI